MRELTNHEMNSVAGGSLAPIGSYLGYNFGSIIDTVASFVGISTNVGSYTGQIGTGIAQVISLNLSGGFSNIKHGINGVINNVIDTVFGIFR